MRVPYYTIASLPSMLRRAIDPSSKSDAANATLATLRRVTPPWAEVLR